MKTETTASQSDNPPSSSNGSSPAKTGSVAIRTLAAAIVGGIGAILSWKAILLTGDVFVLPPDLAGLGFGAAPSAEDAARLQAATMRLKLGNAAVWMATAGAILGALWGFMICLARRLRYSGIRMIFSTILAGAAFGAIAGVTAIWIDTIARRHLAPGASDPEEYIALFMHSATWLIVGLGIGIGIALGGNGASGIRAKTALVIALAGMVGGCLFPIAAAILFPAINSGVPIPYLEPDSARVLWFSMPSVLMGLAVGRSD